jgi:hypothetical protein
MQLSSTTTSVYCYWETITVSCIQFKLAEWLHITISYHYLFMFDPFIVITIRSFPHSWLITGFITRVTWPVPLVEHDLLTHPEQVSYPPFFRCLSRVRVTHVVKLHVFSCEVRYDVRVKTMFASSLLLFVLNELNAVLMLFALVSNTIAISDDIRVA